MVFKHLELVVFTNEEQPEFTFTRLATSILENAGVVVSLNLRDNDSRFSLITLELALRLCQKENNPTILERLRKKINDTKATIGLSDSDKKILQKELNDLVAYCINRSQESNGYHVTSLPARASERISPDIALIAPHLSLRVKFVSDPDGAAFAI